MIPDPGWLHSHLISRAGQLAVAGAGAGRGGAAGSLPNGLAWRLSRLDEAAERAWAGLALDTPSRLHPISRTKDLIDRNGAAPP